MKNYFNRAYCPGCKKPFKDNDPIYLNEFNFMRHMKCYMEDGFGVIDRGTYKEIVSKYDFFDDLRVF